VSCNFADYVIVNSRSCARSLHDDLKVNHNRVGIINNGVGHINRDDENRARKRSEWQIPTDATVIGTVGNLKSEKNPLLFIRIFEELNKSSADEPLYFIWIGDGKERLVVEDYLRTFNTDMRKKILFPGERDDIIDILSAFDVFVLTSYYEGLPNALMEAMAAGLPCVATRVEGTIDVVGDTEEDILEWASPKDPMGFAKTVRGLIDDKKRCTLMGARARAFVQSTYSIEKMVDLHRKVFTDVLSKDLPGS
jgi:glycosyltransferase involved in cell wall biosynthesis